VADAEHALICVEFAVRHDATQVAATMHAVVAARHEHLAAALDVVECDVVECDDECSSDSEPDLLTLAARRKRAIAHWTTAASASKRTADARAKLAHIDQLIGNASVMARAAMPGVRLLRFWR
jgi:hypothetical protein